MATVHLAVSYGAEGFRRYFVVKRLREDVALMPQVVHQFINEARVGASLVHSRSSRFSTSAGSGTSTSWRRSTSWDET